MAEARVKARLWVDMALRLGNNQGRYGTVLHRGDNDSGGVLVVLRGREGNWVLSQIRTAEGGAASASASPSRAMSPVSTSPATKAGCRSVLTRKAALVFSGQIADPASMAPSRSRASSRVRPWAMTLAIIGS